MLRKLGLSVAIASALLATKVSALGMGEIRIKSALNEPLHAEIALFQVDNLSPLQIKSRMADLNDFALSGLATQQALSDVRFQTRVRADGSGRIILTSKLPITEPFMNFLVEVNWPSGRLIREYTLLLDPPSYQSSLNGRQFNSSAPSKKAPIKRSSSKAVSKVVTKKVVPNNVTVKKGQYYIGAKDTLWDVALSTRPNSGVTPQQMMILIQRKNPHAFPNANINVMDANVVIDLPSQAEIDALSIKDARAEADKQTRLWKSGNLPKVIASTKQTPAKDSAKMMSESSAKTDKAEDEKTAAKTEEVKSDAKEQIKPGAKAEVVPESEAVMVAKPEMKVAEKGMLNVVGEKEAKEKREMQAQAEARALAASKDSDKIAELLSSNAELDVKLALSQESIDKLERDNSELKTRLDTIVKQLEDINRLIMLKDEQMAVIQQEQEVADEIQQMEDKEESQKSWLDKLMDNPVALAAGGIGWLLAIVAGVVLLLRRKKKDINGADDVEDKSEPTISLPDDMIEEEVQELGELDDPETVSKSDDSIEDLDLDLDLDLDMDLDESFDGATLDESAVADADDGDDLAAELDAQLVMPEEDDDDLDMLDGIDSLEFDLGDTGEESADIELDEALDEEPAGEEELSEEDQALAEFAAAMDEAPEEDDAEQELSAEDQALAEFAAAMDESPDEDDAEEELSAEDQALAEFAAAMEETPQEAEEVIEEVVEESTVESADTDEFSSDDEAFEIEIDDEKQPEPEVEPQATIVEEDELDISELSAPVSSLEELEEAENLKESEEQEQSVDVDLEELSLDSAALEEEEVEEQIPMDDALGSLLGEANPSSQAPAAKDLDGELDELLSSTDDDIALDAVTPELDTDNEEDIDLLSGEDGVRMKLDLARAYMEMGDNQGAKDIIEEVMKAGDDAQKSEAQELLDNIESK